MTLSRSTLQILILVFLSWLFFWNASGEFRPGMDAMTYGAVAKNILATGDWRRLHYSQQVYAEFFQHPPLGMWLSAFVFKLLGASDLTQKILPSLFSYLSIAGVVVWGYRWRTPWQGFLAGIVLLTSFRFIKHSIALTLDPFLSAFMLGAVFFALVSVEERKGRESSWVSWQVFGQLFGKVFGLLFGRAMTTSMLSGLCVAAAFMSKGMPAIAAAGIALLILSASALSGKRGGRWQFLGFWVGLAAPILSWIVFGQGDIYLVRYWQESVSARIGHSDILGHLGAVRNLLGTYWPWLPFWVWGIIQIFTRLASKKVLIEIQDPITAAGLSSLAIVVGFSFSGHFLEHYLVPFYPFATIVVANQIAGFLERFHKRIIYSLFWFSIGYSMLLATLTIHVHRDDYLSPIRRILTEATLECQRDKIQRLHFSSKVADVWYATASGLWYSPWDVFSGPGTVPPGTSHSQILVASRFEEVHPDWVPTSIRVGDLRIFQEKGNRLGSEACPSLLP